MGMMGAELYGAFFGVASAVSWGSADFCGGWATRRSNVFAVLFISQVFGSLLLLVMVLLGQEALAATDDLLWGVAGGGCGMVGITAFYVGLARGKMGVVAPISAVVTAGLPVLAGAILEGLPPAEKYLGFALGLLSIWLVSRPLDGRALQKQQLVLPVIAGLGFGGFFICLDQAAANAVLWPLIAARATSLGLLMVVSALMGKTIWPAKKRLPLIVLSGVLDTGGNLLYMLAARTGRLDVAAVLASLYPVATLLLARFVLHEHFGRRQLVGILGALGAVLLIAV